MKIHDLTEKRSKHIDELKSLTSKALSENRDLAENEQARFDSLKSDIENLDSQIRRAETVARLERSAPAQALDSDRRGGLDLSRYSVARAIRCAESGKVDGLEGEMSAELSRGREQRGAITIPTAMLLGERRTGQEASTDTKGGLLVPTNVASVADRFRPVLKVESLGATVLRNLVGNLDLPNLVSSGTSYWVGENENTTRSDVTFEKANLSPRTVSAEYAMTRQIRNQANESIEALLRRDIGFLLAQAIDKAAIKAPTGAPNEPQGILDSGIELVATASALTDTIADLIAALELDDVNGTRAFLTNAKVGAVARKIKNGNGDPIPYSTTFHGERVEFSSQVPSNIDGSKSALICGMWSELVIGYWSGVDILLNPYHSDVASKGGALLHAFLDCDSVLRHVEAFSYAKITA